MNTPHKHAEVIKAWADGKQIQAKIGNAPDWRDVPEGHTPLFQIHELQWRIKPEKAYPETQMSGDELIKVWNTPPSLQSTEQVMRFIANAAIRHAIDSGQVVVAGKIVKRLGRAETTLAVAGYTDNGGELWKPPLGRSPDQRAARDMAIAEAVTIECSKYRDRGDWFGLIDLGAIIASVK